MKELITPDLWPNFEADDLSLIKRLAFGSSRPLAAGDGQAKIFKELNYFFPNRKIFLFTSKNFALEFLLKFYFQRSQRRQVLIQAFSSFVWPKAIMAAGGQPIFLDLGENSLNFDLESLKKKISDRVGILITQNTFGQPNDLSQIIPLTRENKILLIENISDCFGSKFQDRFLGNFGDVALLGFGQADAVSSLSGAALIFNQPFLAAEFDLFYQKLAYPSAFWIRRRLLSSLAMSGFRRRYFNGGKIGLNFFRKFKLAPAEISLDKKNGKRLNQFKTKMPNAFALIGFNQIRKLVRLNDHRRQLGQIYLNQGLLPFGDYSIEANFYYLRYPITLNEPKKIIAVMRSRGVYLGDWYQSVLFPLIKRFDRFNYYYGDAPRAETLSRLIYNLPTNILTRQDQAYFLVDELKRTIQREKFV